jgi:hypothetical protein
MAKVTVAEDRAENQGILQYIDGEGSGGSIHPDILARLVELAAAAGCDRLSRRRTRLLVDRATGVIVGCGFGMTYCLRAAGVPPGAGVTWSVRYSDGERLNVRRVFGPGWIVGDFHDGEADWLRSAIAALEGVG